jgi:hypothetical protein
VCGRKKNNSKPRREARINAEGIIAYSLNRISAEKLTFTNRERPSLVKVFDRRSRGRKQKDPDGSNAHTHFGEEESVAEGMLHTRA